MLPVLIRQGWQRINQLLTREQHLIPSLSNEPVGLGRKSWRETLGDPIGRPRSLNPNRFAYDWLNVLRDATLQLVPIARFTHVSRMLPKGHL